MKTILNTILKTYFILCFTFIENPIAYIKKEKKKKLIIIITII